MTSQGLPTLLGQDPILSAQAADGKTETRPLAVTSVVPVEVRYCLKDPVDFARFLRDADVRLIRCKYLQDLVLSKRPLPRRQEAESDSFPLDGKIETALVSHEEVDDWAKGECNAIICSISHAWETREHPDPCRFQLQRIVNHAGLFQAAFEAEVWIFYDYVSLFQYEREVGHQQSSFGKAMENMHIMYSHECTMTFRIESLTPQKVWETTKLDEKEVIQVFDAQSKRVLAKPLKDLVENRTDYVARGWCKAEIEWSSLRTVNLQHQRIDQPDSEKGSCFRLNARIPMTPANFREQMEKAKFTHRSDAESVIHLQKKIFYEKVTMYEHLELEGLAASQVAALAEALPLYQNLKSLKITKYECSEAEAKAFGEALAATSIERLQVSAEREGGPFMGKAIALALKSDNSIRHINLSDSGMGPEAAQAIAEALKVNKSVQNIDLAWNEIGPEGAKAVALALKSNNSIRDIDLAWNKMGPEGAKAIAEALKINNSVQNINLAENRIGPEGGKAVALALKSNDSIRDIDLTGNQMGPEAAQAIAEALKVNKSVQNINFASNEIGPEGAKAVEEALARNRSAATSQVGHEVGEDEEDRGHNRPSGREPFEMPMRLEELAFGLKRNQTIRQVMLYHDPIGDQGCKALAAAMQSNNTIKRIGLGNMNIGSEGAQALAEALVMNETIYEVFLGSNEMGDEGCKALAKALKRNQTIRRVGLQGNQIGDEGCKAIAAALKMNRAIEMIYLAKNNISSEGAQALAEALKMNQTIQEVNLEHNQIGDEGCKALAEAMKMNQTIVNVNLKGNQMGDVGRQALRKL